jgi:hypothetical protein
MEGGHAIGRWGDLQNFTLRQADVRSGIAATLRGQRDQLWRAAYLETLRNKATVVNHAARRIVESLGTRPPTAQK